MANTVNINQNNNDVSLQDNNRRIIITDNNAGTTINVTQPVTSIVTISTLGPQGAQGPAGEIPSTGSFVLTSSFNTFTASYYVDSASFETQILSNSSSIALLSGSFETTSGSFSTRITNLENFSSSLDATFATDAELNTATASLSASIANLSSSFEIFSGSYNTGSFTGSFIGDGSQLTGIVSSKWTGSNPISRDSNVEITGSLKVKTGVIELNTATGQLIRSGIGLVNWPSGTLNSFSGNTSINWETRETLDSSGIISIDWDSRSTWDSSNTASIDWDTRQLIKSDGSTITVDWENGIFTGSLHGTASWAENSISSSYALSSSYADHATSASYALTASYVNPLNQNVIITGSIYIPDNNHSIYFSGSNAASRLTWNDTDGTLDLGLKGGNVTLQLGQELVQRVVNKTGANLLESQYRVVRMRRVDEGGAQGQRLAIVLAQANNDANSVDTLGIVTENITENQEGFITTSGLVRGINTTGTLQGETWTDGDVLYLSPFTPGVLTKIKPQAPNHTVIMGYVVYAHNTQGKIFVKVDNGYEIDELHNVLINTASLAAGQLLVRSGSNATGVWINTNQLTGSYSITGSLTISGSSTFTNIGPAIFSGSVTGINGFTGSLFGTSSWANQSISSSVAISASYATTASYITLAQTASYVQNAISSSYALSSSYAQTSSYVNPLHQNVIITGSVKVINGNVNIESNSNFFQGTNTSSGNVSLIGVNNQDQIYIGNQGYTNIIADETHIRGDLQVTGSLDVTGSINVLGPVEISNPNSQDLIIHTDNGFELIFTGSGTANVQSKESDLYLLAGTSKFLALGAGNVNALFTVREEGTSTLRGGLRNVKIRAQAGYTLGLGANDVNDIILISGSKVTVLADVSSSTAGTASFGHYIGDGSEITGVISSSYALTSSFAQTASYIDGGFY